MDRLTKRGKDGAVFIDKKGFNPCNEFCHADNCNYCITQKAFTKLAHYEDLEEQGRLIDWRKTAEEKPDSTRHLIVTDGEIISHYGYYLKPKDKWFTNYKCEEEISEPMFWMDMPEPPKESLYSECCAKMDEVE